VARLNGITWAHRRAIEPLLQTLPEFRKQSPGIEISWDARSLAGFEFQSVRELANNYDLIVLDHPFVGDIAAGRYLLPLDELLGGRDNEFVGPSLDTYRYGGSIWALPLDAACQVAVSRPDLFSSFAAQVPATWDDMLKLGQDLVGKGVSLAIGLKGVHSLMTFFSLMANSGSPCAVSREAPLFDGAAARIVLTALRALVKLCPPEALDWNSIELHDAMVARDDLLYCPAVYCYATYAESDQRRPLRFHPPPGLVRHSPEGSTIGGTGLGISVRCDELDAAMAYARFLLKPATQLAFAAHHGQPARVEAWQDATTDGRYHGCFSTTRATVERAWIRPRYRGYLAFQERAGALVERHLRGELDEAVLLKSLQEVRDAPFSVN
jgi:multiple sugar transport system substrate-binding protein